MIDQIFILFPDPWPKRRHWKNRIVQPDFLDELAERAGEGAPLYFRTDHEPYFQAALTAVAQHPRWQLDPAAPWPFELSTVFQQRAPTYYSLVARRLPAGDKLSPDALPPS